MQQETPLDYIISMINNRDDGQIRKHKFLLMYPSSHQYTQIILSLYKWLNYTIPSPTSIAPLESGLLNYTFIKSEVENEEFSDTIELYTIYSSEQADKLVFTLEPYSKDINLIFFTDCNNSKLTTLVNAYIDENNDMDVESYKSLKILPSICSSLYPFFSTQTNAKLTQLWKSYNILYTDVSKWTYNAITIPIVDFIQQFLRSLLLEYTVNGKLVYLQYDIKNSNIKTNEFWNVLFTKHSDVKLQTLESKTNANSPTIKYSEVFVSTDSARNIQIIDESFNWPHWQRRWQQLCVDTN